MYGCVYSIMPQVQPREHSCRSQGGRASDAGRGSCRWKAVVMALVHWLVGKGKVYRRCCTAARTHQRP